MSSNNKSISDLKKEIKEVKEVRDADKPLETQFRPQPMFGKNIKDSLTEEDAKIPLSAYLVAGIIFVIIIMLLAIPYLKVFFYEAPSTLPSILWGGVYPVFVMAFLAFTAQPTVVRDPKTGLRVAGKQGGRASGILNGATTGIFPALILSAALVQGIPPYLGLATYYFAVEKIPNQVVLVGGVSCQRASKQRGISFLGVTVGAPDRNNRAAYLSLMVAPTAQNNNTAYEIRFPYDLCKGKSNINRLVGQEVIIHGRKGILGKVYDGFYYPPELDLN